MVHTTTGLNPALDYTQGWFRMTCILKEGNITAGSGVYTQNGELVASNVTIASAISKGDIVSLSTDTANTASATVGRPVVTTTVTGVNFGLVASNPQWVKVPSSNQTTWADMLAGGYFRIAEVWIGCIGMFDVLTEEASSGTAITPGDALVWDMSDDGWVQKISGGFDDGDGDVWDLTANSGCNGLIAYPIALHYSESDTGHVLAAFGLVPWMSEA